MATAVHKSSAVDHEKRVLFISSYSASFPSLPEQIEGLQSVFSASEILFDIEFMDTKRLNTDETYRNFYNSLSYKLEALEPYDIILVGDDNGLEFVTEYQEELFEGIPIVFFAVNSFDRALEASQDPLITGVVEELSIEETIEVAMALTPEAREIIAITDNTVSGQAGLAIFNEAVLKYTDYDFKVINSESYSYQEIGEQLKGLDESSILLYLAMFEDKLGETNTIYESARMLEEMSPIPVYVPYSNGVGQGFFGGKVVYHNEQGKLAAQIAMEVLSGKAISTIPLVLESPNQYLFDYNKIERYKMTNASFPESTVYINQEISSYQRYRGLIWAVASIIMGLIVGIIILLINIKKREKAEVKLTIANGELMAISEELLAQEEELRSNYNDLSKSQVALNRSKERYSLIFSASSEGLWDYDYKTKITYVSGGWHNDFIKDANIQAWHGIIDAEDKLRYLALIDDVVKGISPKFMCEYRVTDLNGKVRWIKEKGVATYDSEGVISRIVGSHVDITLEKEQDDKIMELAYIDVLTDLPNRVSLYEDFRSKYHISEGIADFGLLLFIDVDNFKYVNDTYGHVVGDDVLIELGLRLKGIVDEKTHVYRLGGDEFVVVLEDDHQGDRSMFIGDIQKMLSAPIVIGHTIFNLTSSIGVVRIPENGHDLEEFLKNADTAMYKAKESGKDQFMYFSDAMKIDMEERMIIQNNIRKALKDKEFQLYYQPIIDVVTKEVNGYEGLIRWISEEHGMIGPDRFIGVAEQMGIIVPIGNWVFETACNFCIKVNSKSEKKVTVTINVSPVQLVRQDFVSTFIEIIRRTGVDPCKMGIEITETALMESFEDNRDKLAELQTLGIKIYLDDFGTGYSSLNYLRELPIDVLKIDKTFIDDVVSKDNGANLTEDIILIAHKVGLNVVAEGVEVNAQYNRLVSYECDNVQGYLFSKPVEESQALSLVSRKIWS